MSFLRMFKQKVDPKDRIFRFLVMKNYEIFKAQDPEDDHFDVTFQIGDKKLLASKFMLCSVSTTFQSLFSNRWTKTDESIVITQYGYDDFKEFLTFIYSGECSLTWDNIASIVDMAEYYGIAELKDFCDEFLPDMKLNEENICEMLEFAYRYSLTQFKECIHDYISEYLSECVQSDDFIKLPKCTVKTLVKYNQESERQEELFKLVYKWAENQATEKLKPEKSLDLNSMIKEELSDILPFFKFDKMNDIFFTRFVVEKSFLFSAGEISSMFKARTKIFVKIIDGRGKVMKGELDRGNAENVAAVIESFKGITCSGDGDDEDYYWNSSWMNEDEPIPDTPSSIIKNNGVEWYLVYDHYGDLVVRHREEIDDDDDYLLAEMFPENGFKLSSKCKIDVFCFA